MTVSTRDQIEDFNASITRNDVAQMRHTVALYVGPGIKMPKWWDESVHRWRLQIIQAHIEWHEIDVIEPWELRK
jgi:hypothetical protein